jgi:hypothetical protein
LQRLEARTLLTDLTYHGGPVLTHVDVQPIYLGSFWEDSVAGSQAVGFLQHYLGDMVNAPPNNPGVPSNFLDDVLPSLNPVGTSTTGDVFSPAYIPVNTTSGQQIDDSYIRSQLPASPNESRVDLVFAPPGSWVSIGSSENSLPGPGNHFLGYHSFVEGSNGVPIYYMVIVFPGWPNIPMNLTNADQLTVVTSHELAETISDPQFNGWYDDALGPYSGETGDVCPGPADWWVYQPSSYAQDFYLTQAVWANQEGPYPGHPTLNGVENWFTHYHFEPYPLAQTFTAQQGQSYQGTLANFSDAGASSANFAAQIAWGDGSVTTGQITTASDGSFNVEGTHTFAAAGDYLARVAIEDKAAGTTLMSHPDFAVSGIQPTPAAPDAFVGVAFQGAFAKFTDSDTSPATYRVSIDWGDRGADGVDGVSGSSSTGTVQPNSDGTFSILGDHTYAAAGDYTITYSLARLTSGAAPVTITGTTTVHVSRPTPPSVSSRTYTISPGSTLAEGTSGGLLAGASDPQGLPLTAQVVTQPSHGSLSLGADGGFIYVPQSGFSGADTFTFDATDGVLKSGAATVTLDVGLPPVALPHTYWHVPDQPVTIAASVGVLSNDTDPSNLPLTARLAMAPSFGTVSLQPDGSFTYIPTNLTYVGTDHFSYVASDGEFTSDPADVTILLGSPPIAIDQSYTVGGGTKSTFGAGQGVLLNDVDPAGLPLQAKLVAGPTSGGSVALSPDGSFTVTPDPGFVGKLTFTYQAYDSVASSNTATVTVNVIGPPVATNSAYTVVAGQTLYVPAPGVLGDDTDPSGLPLSVASHTHPGFGTLTINSDGSFSYTPDPGLSGLDSFTYVATDGLMSSNTARVDITVARPLPPMAVDHAYTITAGQTLHGSGAELLANDTDPSGLPLSVKSLTTPMFGTVALNSDGSFNFTPFAGFSGTGSFIYTISDSMGLTASATVVVTVQPQSPPPPPHVLGIVGSTHSRRGLTSIEIAFDEALNAISAQNGDFTLLLGVKRRGHVVFSKNVRIRGIQYDGNDDTVAINLAKPARGPVQVTVRKGIAAANGAMSIADFSTIVN